ncbi:SDR family NAD(P)-dependent oxidoreductase [Kribbella antibiotica]|uniref:SDR family NAD(P)-dependent oxidoreductase n=1 Tax=Kribbella antibiotica TaxID=190195 RepID=A0A4R4ZJH4_9ACTN|nr:oxidoreductase [Kribbella antibiotica]TDD56852.1 SDR family NAD(P)-dependent oxidoreductase [Kribbella antibiotica]
MSAEWTERDIPDQTGRTILITGANSGLGLRSAVVLAGKGARVLLGCRSPERGQQALAEVNSPYAELVALDLADLTSVRAAADSVRERSGDRLDVLMNNAGITGVPFGRTADGFESQFGTNHLGHAALTWLLMPALRNGTDARVVTVASIAHRGRGLDLDDPNFERRTYRAHLGYAQAKRANLVFALELDRRLRAAGLPIRSVAAHPGMTNTELFPNALKSRGALAVKASRVINALITQPLAPGTLPQLYAATSPDVQGGGYYGPAGPLEIRGKVAPAKPTAKAADETTGRRLWELTAELTGITPDPS